MLSHIRSRVDKSLKDFVIKIEQRYQLNIVDPILYASIKDFVLRDGKRVRPILFVLSYKGYKKKSRRISPSIYYVSTCVELLHNFMLVHDDIIDRSSLRRGKPTMHRLLSKAAKSRGKDKLGQDLGIVTGDIIYALAFDAFLSINEDFRRKEEALKYFIQTAVLTAMGEFIDTLHGERSVDAVTEKDVLLNYSLKTARYTFDCPLVVGAKLAGASKEDIRTLSDIGLLVGQAFQMQDDIIGIFDSEKNIGKSILSDLAESKKTILVCHANNTLKGKKKKEFLKYFAKHKVTYKDLVRVRRVFLEAGSLQYSLNEIEKRLAKSIRLFSKLSMKSTYRNMVLGSFIQLFKHSEKIAARHNIAFNPH